MKHFTIKPKDKRDHAVTVWVDDDPSEIFELLKKDFRYLEKHPDTAEMTLCISGCVYDREGYKYVSGDFIPFVKYDRTLVRHIHNMTKEILEKGLIKYNWFDYVTPNPVEDIVGLQDRRNYISGTDFSISKSEFKHFCKEIEEEKDNIGGDTLDTLIEICIGYGEKKKPKYKIYAVGDYKKYSDLASDEHDEVFEDYWMRD